MKRSEDVTSQEERISFFLSCLNLDFIYNTKTVDIIPSCLCDIHIKNIVFSNVKALWLLSHMYSNLLPRCTVCLPAPLLSYVPTMVTNESTILVPHCCNGGATRRDKEGLHCKTVTHKRLKTGCLIYREDLIYQL